MAFAIHAGAAGTIRRNFWNNVHFHPTDAVEDLWGQEILNRWAADGTWRFAGEGIFADILEAE